MKSRKKDIINIIIIVSLILIYVLLTTNFFHYSYGSTTDWDCQHWTIPDYFRKQFYETGTIFNNFAPNLGDGQNIYYLSYYGYLSPIIMVSFLLPFVPMKVYIEFISIVSMIASGVLFYLWMRKKYNSKLSLVSSLMFIAASPLLFHSHRHIMYTCYMPFLILAFGEIDKKFSNIKETKISWKFIIYTFLIITSNYFFSVSALFALCIYELHSIAINNKGKKIKKEIKKNVVQFIIEIMTAVFMSAILLLPTMSVILNGRSKSNVSISLLNLIVPNLDFDNVFYQAYTTGISVFSMIALIRNLRSKKYNYMSFLLLVSLLFPVVCFFLNGTMYIEYKVLIPLIPLITYNTTHYLKILDDNKKLKMNIINISIELILILILLFININSNKIIPIVIELVVIGIFMLQKNRAKYMMLYAVLLSFIMMFSNIATDKLELNKNYVNNVDTVVANELVDKYNYRFTTDKNILKNVNYIEFSDFNIGSIYSSTSNGNYKNYYYDFGVEVSQRSYGKITATENILFNIINSNKYFIGDGSDKLGYELIDKKSKVYVNNDVLTIARINNNYMSKREFDQLVFPYNMEALYKYTIVDEKIDDVFESDIEEYKGTINISKSKDEYNIVEMLDNKLSFNSKEDKKIKIKFDNINDDDIIIIEFNIDGKTCPSKDRSISINGIKNTIPCNEWKYHNKNNVFHYVIDNYSSNGYLNVSYNAGDYNLDNIHIYKLSYSKVKETLLTIKKVDLSIDHKNNQKIYTSVEAEDKDILYLQIPYDVGFEITVNNNKKEYFMINNGMIGFYLEKGMNNIEIEYHAPLLKVAKLVSIAGCLLCVFFIVKGKIRKKY